MKAERTEVWRESCGCHLDYVEVEEAEKLEAEIEWLQEENDKLRSSIASSVDLMNIWARELDIPECTFPWSGTALRDLADRLWSAEAAKENQ